MINTNPGVCVVVYIILTSATLLKRLDSPFLPHSTLWVNQSVDSVKDTVTGKKQNKTKPPFSRKS